MIPTDLIALDLGTTKFCVARLTVSAEDNSPRIETVSVKSGGMHRGMLSNLEEAAKALNILLEKAEKKFNEDINQIVVGVAGSHLKSLIASSSEDISTQVVEPKLLDQLKSNAIQSKSTNDREILHSIPLAYRLNDREWIKCPLGFSGKKLQAEFFLIESDKAYLSDIIRLCNRCGLEVTRLIAEPYASASVTTSENAKKVGVAIADIGGGTTDGIVFQAEKPVGAFTVNIGGKLMTKDLSIGLGLSYEEAERVKTHFGLQVSDETSNLEVTDVNGLQKTIHWKEVYQILGPRITELSTHIKKQIKPYLSSLGAGLLLTGGGSEVKGITTYMQKEFPSSVKTIMPEILSHANEERLSDKKSVSHKELATKYATVAGLLNVEIILQTNEKKLQKSSKVSRYFNNFVSWLKELS